MKQVLAAVAFFKDSYMDMLLKGFFYLSQDRFEHSFEGIDLST